MPPDFRLIVVAAHVNEKIIAVQRSSAFKTKIAWLVMIYGLLVLALKFVPMK
jgi:hypothetical protein